MKNKSIPVKEKIKLTSGQGSWHLFESDNLKGRQINVADGPHGVRVYEKPVEGGDFLSKRYLEPTTLFPSASAMASTWNTELIESAGKTIGKECRYHQVDVLLGPGINLKRSPLGGRNFEYYSEDPYLTSKIGEYFVKGVQSAGVGACIKHYGLNEQETMRRFVDVDVDERTMHEMYLYPFYKIIKAANPWMIMSSYNRLNGDYASESSYLLQDVLRKQWHYEGVVVSDWGAVQDKVKSIKNGMNADMPGPSAFEDEVNAALEDGRLTEAELDASLAPVFKLHDKVNTIEKLESIDLDHHHTIAKDVAKEAMVLLENDGILPLKDTAQPLGIIGEFAKQPRTNGGGSATVKPYNQEIPYKAFEAVFKNINYAPGYHENDTTQASLDLAVTVAKESDTVLFFTGTTDVIETEGKDREHIHLPSAHLEVFDAIRKVNKNIIVILSNGSALDLRNVIPHSRAMLETWFLGGAAGEAIVDVVTGCISPSGRLQETFPLKIENTPHYGTFPQLAKADYHQDLIMNGYRYYDTHDYDVLYPFGYGLSYADIAYKDITWKTQSTNDSAYITATVTLENTSDIGAYETVQIYVGTSIPYLIKPKKELKAFKKVWVDGKESKTITIAVPLDAFETYDVNRHSFVVYNGTYTLSLGQNCRDIASTHTINITDQIPFIPHMTIDYPVKYLELYYPTWFAYIESNYRTLRWHEKEEPIWRMLDRYKRHKDIDDATMKSLINQIKADINKNN
ncbi:MAG: beta-glucosidase family protein [Bacillota bacterium]